MTDTNPKRAPGAFLFDAHKGIIGVDIETCSAADLGDYGAWAYSLHPSTIVYVVSFCYTEGASVGAVWRWYPGQGLPPELCDYLAAGGQLLAHNAGFEHAIWSNILERDYAFPALNLEQWRDTQPVGHECNLPSKLEGLAGALGTPVQKDTEGARLMKRLAVAREENGEFVYPHCTDIDLERLSLYCDDDVLAMMGAWLKMKPLSVLEERVRRLDQRINARGVFLDQAFARKVRKLAEKRSGRLAAAAQTASDWALDDAVAAPALKRWLKHRGVAVPTVRKKNKAGKWYDSETTDKRALGILLERADLPDDVRDVLNLRLEATKATSLGKLKRVETMVGADGRLRNAFQYCAANTGRWSSHGLQVHNLPKDKLSPAASKLVSAAIEQQDLDLLEIAETRPLAALSSKLRSVLSAAPGHDLIAADFSSVEACVCAWLAGQQDKLEFLHDYFREIGRFRRGARTTKPQDLYEFAAESIGSDSRQLGKVAELALQYGMGDPKFASTATDWGVPLELKQAARVKRAWRGTNVMIVRFWKELENAAKAAVTARGSLHRVGKLLVYANESCLFVQLPSGRRLRYWKPSVVVTTKKVKYVDKETEELVETEIEGPELRFWTQNPAKNGMTLETTYGGKLVENATQAVSRDLLAESMLRLEAASYPLVAHVHDSAASEVLAGAGDVDEFCFIMAQVPAWGEGCPIDADGYRDKRFRG